MNLLLAGILVYVLVQIAIGVLVSRKIRSEDDYLLAGRSLGPVLATFSFFATWFGAETCIDAAGQIYADGLAGGSAEPFGYGLCVLFLGLVFAASLWRRGITTVADLFRQRYSPGIEKIVIFVTVPGSIFWAAAQIRAFGQVLDATGGVGVSTGITIAAAAVIIYTVTGGLKADVVTDVIQGIVIILGLVLLAWVVTDDLGGWPAAVSAIPSERLQLFDLSRGMELVETWAVPICGSVLAQELIARVLACRSPQVARNSALLGGGLYLLVGMIPVMLGLVGLRLLPGLEDQEQFLPTLAREHFTPLLYIIFAGALVSAILSTVDSTLLAGSAVICHNLVIPARPGMAERTKLLVNRLGVVGCGLAAFGLALSAESIYSLVELSSAVGGGGLFLLFAVGQFSQIGGRLAAYAALITSSLTWMILSWVCESTWPYTGSLIVAAITYFAVACQEPATTTPKAA
ncbi:MAG TPA: sodium:solute symporter [Verrucomicrobiales bacterium]|nr:sodium:solute symporter [Verrucomicrobiales bacterium]